MNKEELTTLPTPQGTSHCSCLEHCFLLQVWRRRSYPAARWSRPRGGSADTRTSWSPSAWSEAAATRRETTPSTATSRRPATSSPSTGERQRRGGMGKTWCGVGARKGGLVGEGRSERDWWGCVRSEQAGVQSGEVGQQGWRVVEKQDRVGHGGRGRTR